MNIENIYQALGTFLDAMRPFLVSVLTNHFPGEPWEGVFFSRLTASKQELWNQAARQGVESMLRIDFHNLTFLASKFRDELAEELGNDRSKTYTFENVMNELKDARNKCQHFTPLTDDEKERAFSNMKLIANMLGMTELRQEIDHLQKKHTVTPAAVAPIPVTTTLLAIFLPSFLLFYASGSSLAFITLPFRHLYLLLDLLYNCYLQMLKI